jgi:hypothetical protein
MATIQADCTRVASFGLDWTDQCLLLGHGTQQANASFVGQNWSSQSPLRGFRAQPVVGSVLDTGSPHQPVATAVEVAGAWNPGVSPTVFECVVNSPDVVYHRQSR